MKNRLKLGTLGVSALEFCDLQSLYMSVHILKLPSGGCKSSTGLTQSGRTHPTGQVCSARSTSHEELDRIGMLNGSIPQAPFLDVMLRSALEVQVNSDDCNISCCLEAAQRNDATVALTIQSRQLAMTRKPKTKSTNYTKHYKTTIFPAL